MFSVCVLAVYTLTDESDESDPSPAADAFILSNLLRKIFANCAYQVGICSKTSGDAYVES